MRKFLFFVLFAALPFLAQASNYHCSSTVCLNGIYYEISNCDEAFVVNGMGLQYEGPIVTVVPKYENGVAVKNCYKGRIVIPSKIKYQGQELKVRKIARNTFNGCTELRSLTIPYTVSDVEWRAIVDCPKLERVSWQPDVCVNFGRDNFLRCPNIKDTLIVCDTILIHLPVSAKGQYKMPNTIKVVGASAFMDCSDLSAVRLSENVHSIYAYAFKNCVALDSLDLPEKLRYIGEEAFNNCSKLSDIIIPRNVRNTGRNILANCEALKTVVFAATDNMFDGPIFDNNPNLSAIIVPKGSEFRILLRGNHNAKMVTKSPSVIQQEIDNRNQLLKKEREEEEARIKLEQTRFFLASLVKINDCIQATFRTYKSGVLFDVPVNKKMNINLYSSDGTLNGKLYWVISDTEYYEFYLDDNNNFPGYTHRIYYKEKGGDVLINTKKIVPCN